jgi:putative endopeptidase
MRMKSVVLICTLALAVPALAQTSNKPATGSSGFDLGQLDTTANPCVDFYQYACGGWRAKNPLPADKSRYGRYDEMAERNREKLRTILEEVSKPGAAKNAVEKQVGDYYAGCMNEDLANKKGAQPLQPYLQRIAGIKDRKGLIETIAWLHLNGIGALFNFSSGSDFRNANQVIAHVDQGGIGLPDRDYYLKDDAKNKERRAKYVEHVQKMFELLGENPDKATADAAKVMAIETELARASMDRISRRNPKNLDHKMKMDELVGGAPNFEFATYFKASGVSKFTDLNNVSPGFFKDVNAVIEKTPIDDWKTYLRWRVVRRAAPRLSSEFVNEDYRFNSAYMRGTKEMEVRWKRCVRATDNDLGEALGKLFVERYFGPEGKQKMRELVDNVTAAMAQAIQEVDWMSPQTKEKALVKLKALRKEKLGFPEKYRDYSNVKISRDDLLGNFIRATQFEVKRDYAKIGKPLDRSEWGMTPPTVNAYYDPQGAEIVFPAGILQPPMFDLNADDAYSYGAIGRVVGHELTHGFDDEGRKFDPEGNLTDWWTEADAKAFEERASCIEKQYEEYSPVNDENGKPIYLKGKLTLGENTADVGGVRMAFNAYMKSLEGKERKIIDGFTPEQRFFLGYAVSRCENVTDQTARLLIDTDPHAPGKFRLIGAVSNHPAFWKAFSCKPSDPMVRGEKACKVW